MVCLSYLIIPRALESVLSRLLSGLSPLAACAIRSQEEHNAYCHWCFLFWHSPGLILPVLLPTATATSWPFFCCHHAAVPLPILLRLRAQRLEPFPHFPSYPRSPVRLPPPGGGSLPDSRAA